MENGKRKREVVANYVKFNLIFMFENSILIEHNNASENFIKIKYVLCVCIVNVIINYL